MELDYELIRKEAELELGRREFSSHGHVEVDHVAEIHFQKAAAAADPELLAIATELPGDTLKTYEAMGGTYKLAADMPPFLEQDRPKKVKEIYTALKREHPDMPAEMKARIAARQGKKGHQKQGPPYKGALTKEGFGQPMFQTEAAPDPMGMSQGGAPTPPKPPSVSGTLGSPSSASMSIKEPKIPGQNGVAGSK